MKHVKHLASLLLALVMALALTIPALAAPSDTCTVTFRTYGGTMLAATDDTPVTASKFAGYQLLDLSLSLKDESCHTGTGDDKHKDTCYNYAYTFDKNGEGGTSKYSTILLSVASDLKDSEITDINGLLTYLGSMNADTTRKFADAVYRKIQAASLSADATSVDYPGFSVDQGYWLFADITEYEDTEKVVKSLVLLDTAGNPSVTVEPKQNIPTVDKEVSDAVDGTYGDSTDVSIGKPVYFKITGTLPSNLGSYLTYKYSFHDTMSKGLTYVAGSAEVTIDGVDYTDKFGVAVGDYSSTTGTTITVSIDDLLSIVDDGDPVVSPDSKIVLTYSAILNADAEISPNSNPNKVYLKYSNDPYGDGEGKTPEDEVKVYTYEFDLVKTDGDKKLLTGAEFKLYDAETGGNEIALVKEGSDYRVATPEEKAADGFTSAVIKAGSVTIKGLGSGTYWLEETKAPAGYNKLNERVEVKIEGKNNRATFDNGTYEDGGVRVINQTGTELPSTGGIGTTIFYVLGSALALGAAVLLVTRKRMRDQG